ncbi:MAG: MBL fold metallo-hydrolase, partial [Clostridiales bacterium]
MNITWLGHSCFVVESAGWRVVLDPYYVETYPALHIEADEALCSHGHRDHAFLEAVTLSGRDKSESPFTVETVSTFHDDKQGSLRGENIIHILRAEGVTLVHCGDLGHE